MLRCAVLWLCVQGGEKVKHQGVKVQQLSEFSTVPPCGPSFDQGDGTCGRGRVDNPWESSIVTKQHTENYSRNLASWRAILTSQCSSLLHPAPLQFSAGVHWSALTSGIVGTPRTG